MSEPSPLSDPGREAVLAFVDATREPFGAARAEAVWRASLRRAERGARRGLGAQALAFAVACAVGAVVTASLTLLNPAARLRREGVKADAQAELEWRGDGLAIDRGAVRVKRASEPLAIATPHVSVTLTRATALFDVTPSATRVRVIEGEVVWRTPAGERVFPAGSTLEAPRRTPAFALPLRGGEVEGCSGSGGAQRACLERLAPGSGLQAQLALYQLGADAHAAGDEQTAARHFSSYLERFAAGALAPEASIGLMLSLDGAGDLGGAAREADRFLARFASDPQAAAVREWRKSLP